MSQLKLFHFSCIVLFSLALAFTPIQSQAATKGKHKAVQQEEKEKIILLPLVVSAEAQSMISEMQAAAVQGLEQKYLVYSGDRVLQELKKAANRENHAAKHDCDETRCLQDIATAFQTENVAVVHINKIEGGYLLSLSIKAVISNEAVFDNSLPCKGCDAFQVVDKLKELVGAPTTVTSGTSPEAPQSKVNLSDPETALWEEAKKGNAEEDYQAYLTTYPKGKYAPLAKTKLARLKEEASAAEATQRREQAAAAAERQKREAAARPTGFVSQGGLTWMPISFMKNWSDANAYCSNTAINGQNGWRLPTKEELVALYNSGAMNNHGWTLIITWSSTPDSAGLHNIVLLNNGFVTTNYDANGSYVTCVR